MTRISTIILLMLLLPLLTSAQSSKTSAALAYLAKNYAEMGLLQTDIEDLVITDMYTTKKSGVTHIYYTQAHNGIPINNAIFNINIRPNNTVQHHGNRLISNVHSQIAATETMLSAEDAINVVATDLDYTGVVATQRLTRDKNNRMLFTAKGLAKGKMYAQQKYYNLGENNIRLSWEIFLQEAEKSDSWYFHVDAGSGEVINKRQNTIYCKMESGFHNHSKECNRKHPVTPVQSKTKEEVTTAVSGDGASYFVLPLPIESPIFGDFQLLVDPSLESASPFGWHDDNGVDGPEYTITRGNNVWAYEDSAALNSSQGNEPDGGTDLIFNFPYDEDLDPVLNEKADVTGLFYTNSMMHDLLYQIGFDSDAGAYQVNNYGGGGAGDDPVLAEALDGSGTNNANFSPSPDGFPGTMQMFRWDVSSGLVRTVAPAGSERELETAYAGWSVMPLTPDIDVSGGIVAAQDASLQSPELGCGELINAAEVAGKIAFIYRGACEFGLKAKNAEDAGAIAVIICNVPGVNGGDGDEIIGMAAGASGDFVTIPAVSMAFSTCNQLLIENDASPITLEMKLLDTTGPTEVSSGFDNGVIAHEFAHGVSNRLVGGPSTGGCLTNDEQQGEGISDFFALILTVEEGDTGTDRRGIGNFVDGSTPEGRGIRRFPYSTDFNVNAQTFDDIKGTTAPHPLGEVWTSVTWDIYWKFVEFYGWDADWTNADAGNVRAMTLVIDGMKAAACNPGFIEMRDAILSADDGAHTCELWEIFARRGLGFFAEGGSADDRNDGTEDFEVLPTCILSLKVRKDITELIDPGDTLDVTLRIANHTLEDAENLVVTDNIENGLTLVPGSSSMPATVDGNTISFELGQYESLREDVITYKLISDESIFSTTMFFNSAETDDEQLEWDIDFSNVFDNLWGITTIDANTGDNSYFVSEVDLDSDQRLIYSNIEVSGDRPVLRAWSRTNTTTGENGGFIEFSTDGIRWADATDLIFSGETDVLSYNTFVIPSLSGFSGLSELGDFQPVYLDLSSLTGETISVRFRFGTQDIDPAETLTFARDRGWYIDDLELLDTKSYETEACIMADNAETACTGIFETLINSRNMVATEDLTIEGVELSLYPNPAGDYTQLRVLADEAFRGAVNIYSLDGRQVLNNIIDIHQSENIIPLNTTGYAPGFYILQLTSGDKFITKKLIIE